MKLKFISRVLVFVVMSMMLMPMCCVQAEAIQLSKSDFADVLKDTDNWYMTRGNPENTGNEIILDEDDEITYIGKKYLNEIFTFNVRFENAGVYDPSISGCCFVSRRQAETDQVWKSGGCFVWLYESKFDCQAYGLGTKEIQGYEVNMFEEFDRDYEVSFGVYDEDNTTKMVIYVDGELVQKTEFATDVFVGQSGYLGFRGPNNDGVRMIISKATEYVPATEVRLNRTYDSIKVGGHSYLNVSFFPDNAIKEEVEWKSSDESVAVVNKSGDVTAVGVGSATITVTTKDTGLTASCDVDVYNSLQSGWCGESARWTLGDGVLTISGTGAMYDYDYTNQSPWYNSVFSINQIVVKEGISHVGNYAFRNTANCNKQILIPDSVVTIGMYSFAGCGTPVVSIGNGVTTIGDYAFNFCQSLNTIQLPDGLQSIGDYAFNFCQSLNTIQLPDGLQSIGGSAFSGCKELESIFIPASVNTIGDNTFYGCTSLSSISVADENESFYSIDGVLFDKYVSKLIRYPQNKPAASYTIPDGVVMIQSESMWDCSVLEELTIPNSVSKIENRALHNCTNLTDIYYQGSEDGWNNINEGNDYSGITVHCDDNAKKVCGKNLTWELDESGTLTISGTGDMYNYEYECSPWRTKRNSIKKVELSEGVTSIGDYAFQYGYLDLVQLEEISLPGSIKYIGNNAFDNCDSLENIVFPSGLTYIGDNAFDSTGLSSVDIPNSVEYIGESAFAFCNLEDVQLGNGVKELRYYVFGRCDKLKSVLLPVGLQSIGGDAFYGCESLETIIIPKTVESFGKEAFRDCKSLKSVHIADIASWCDVEFSDYQANPLSNGGALYINGELVEKLLTDNITTIGKYAFGGCTSISNVVLGDSVSVIGEGAFMKCVFSQITVGSGLSSVEKNAFSGCKNLSSVYYVKNKSDWDNISIESGNELLTNAEKYYMGPESGKCGDNLVWNYADGLLVISGTGTMYDYKGTSKNPVPWESKQGIIERVVISEGVTSISKDAFRYCSAMESVIIPSSVTKIGEGAFSGCRSLEKISIPSGVTEIEDVTFSGCESLKAIKIPVSITRFGSFMPGCNRNINVYYEGTQEEWRKIVDGSNFFDIGFGIIHYSSKTSVSLSRYVIQKDYKYIGENQSYTSPYSVIMYGKINGYYDNMGIKYALVKDGEAVGTMELPFAGALTSDGAFAIRVIGKAIVPGTYTATPYYQINSDVAESQKMIVTVAE